MFGTSCWCRHESQSPAGGRGRDSRSELSTSAPLGAALDRGQHPVDHEYVAAGADHRGLIELAEGPRESRAGLGPEASPLLPEIVEPEDQPIVGEVV